MTAPKLKTITVPIGTDFGPLARQLRDAADLLDPQPVDPSKVTVDREDLARVLRPSLQDLSAPSIEGSELSKVHARLSAALGVVSPDPTSDGACGACKGTGWLCDVHGRGACAECEGYDGSLSGCPDCTVVGGCGGTGVAPSPVAAEAARCAHTDGDFRCDLRDGHAGAHIALAGSSLAVRSTSTQTVNAPTPVAEAAPPKPAAWAVVRRGMHSSGIFYYSEAAARRAHAAMRHETDVVPLWVVGEGQAIVNIEALIAAVSEGIVGRWLSTPDTPTLRVVEEVLCAALAAASESTP